MFFVGIEEKAPTKENRQKLIFNRNNVTYKMLINVAIMLYDNTIVNDDDGNNVFKDFFRDGQMEKVYEQFILNFYAINLDRKVYRVHAPKINWHTATDDSGWGEFFDVETEIGDRRTDIVVENRDLSALVKSTAADLTIQILMLESLGARHLQKESPVLLPVPKKPTKTKKTGVE
jgi:5-methylcytosine-specific restriction enzyme subunit McrC